MTATDERQTLTSWAPTTAGRNEPRTAPTSTPAATSGSG